MKRFMMLFIAPVILLVALAGCDGKQFTVDVASLSVSLVSLDRQHEQARAALTDMADVLTKEEHMTLVGVDARITLLRQSVRSLIDDAGGLAKAVVQIDQMTWLYHQARDAYRDARQIICPDAGAVLSVSSCPRMADLSPDEQLALLAFDRQAQRAREALERIIAQPQDSDATRVITQALDIGATAVRVMMATGII